jgi:hypothetical protein
VHVDDVPGDRASDCHGVMDAVGVVRTKKGWQIVHLCRTCGLERVNRVAFETRQPDVLDAVIALM